LGFRGERDGKLWMTMMDKLQAAWLKNSTTSQGNYTRLHAELKQAR
jgi:hypothetical protein